jgi:thioredoxin-dependent peroxiredoxin
VIIPALQHPKELEQRFPKGFKTLRPNLRITPSPTAEG